MNAKQRDEIDKIRDEIEALKVRLEEVRDEEQDKFDNMPENLQCGEKADKMSGDIDILGEVIDMLDEAGITLTASEMVP